MRGLLDIAAHLEPFFHESLNKKIRPRWEDLTKQEEDARGDRNDALPKLSTDSQSSGTTKQQEDGTKDILPPRYTKGQGKTPGRPESTEQNIDALAFLRGSSTTSQPPEAPPMPEQFTERARIPGNPGVGRDLMRSLSPESIRQRQQAEKDASARHHARDDTEKAAVEAVLDSAELGMESPPLEDTIAYLEASTGSGH